MQRERYCEGEAGASGDLRSLLAMLDRTETVAPFDDGLHHLMSSIATLRQRAEQRM